MTNGRLNGRQTNPDVVVVGGGMAGVSAAVGASRQGASVLVVEKYGFFGGMAYAAMVSTFCGLFYRSTSEIKWAVKGFAHSIASELAARCKMEPLIYKEGLCFLPYDPFILHELLLELVERENIACLLHTLLAGATTTSSGSLNLVVLVSGESLNLTPRTVVDCTGDSLVSRYAGLKVNRQEAYQAGALVFALNGLPDAAPESLQLFFMKELHKGVEKRKIHKDCGRISLIPGTLKNDRAFFKLGMPLLYKDNMDVQTEYEIKARNRVSELVAYLKGSHRDLENIYISCIAPQVGIRSSALPIGKACLETEDVLECRKFDDGIARGTWPVEYWGRDSKPEMQYFPENQHYDIPSGALHSSGNDKLFFAGRNISATEQSVASARVIGTCLQTGFAAGTMAAFQANRKSQPEAIEFIRNQQMGDD